MFDQIQTYLADITDWFSRLFAIIEEFLTKIGVEV